MEFKKLAFATILLAFSQNASAWGNWAPESYDKVLHFGSAAGLTVAGYKACRGFTELSKPVCTVASGMFAFAVTGPIKEWSDVNFDTNDMKASGAGTAFGIGLTLIF